MTSCGAVNHACLDSKNEWTIQKNGVLVPLFSQCLQSLLAQDLNVPLKSTFTIIFNHEGALEYKTKHEGAPPKTSCLVTKALH